MLEPAPLRATAIWSVIERAPEGRGPVHVSLGEREFMRMAMLPPGSFPGDSSKLTT